MKGKPSSESFAFRATIVGGLMLALLALGWRAWMGAPSAQAAVVLATEHTRQADWPAYGGGPADDRFSPLTQINRNNVQHLEVAWTYDTGEAGGLQTNPLIIGRTLYGFTPTQKVIALDGATGRKLWRFSAGTPGLQPTRGLSYWTDGKRAVLFAGLLSYLYALDPATGRLVTTFGEAGRIDLRKDLDAPNVNESFAAMTSPGVIYKDMIIVGFRAPETKPALHGDIRAYDVHTGRLRWIFHTIPHPGEEGYDTWPRDAWKYTGAANNWAGMALDTVRGMVYVPTGSAVDDFYGGDRLGNDRFSDTLLALDANTGRRIWDFQGVHHDIWDRDFPSPPSLVTVHSGGKQIDAVAETTKQGFLYLFDRTFGRPIFPIAETAFPASTVPGERTSPTQPVPQIPEPFARQRLTEDMLTTRTPEAHAFALQQFHTFRSDGQFVPLSVDTQTVVFPGFDGGAEWGGSAVDTRTGVIYINANDIPWTGGLTENKPGGSLGATVYQSQCALCHGGDRRGSPPSFPSLIGYEKHLTDAEVTSIIHNGKGRMPSFPNVANARLGALLDYMKTGKDEALPGHAPISSPNLKEVRGALIYSSNCAICHGDQLEGAPSNYPGLLGVRARLSDTEILDNIHHGKGRMPSFSKLSNADATALLRFLGASTAPIIDAGSIPESSSKREVESAITPPGGATRYSFTGYKKFQDPDGYPAVVPPWGTLNAIDLNTGKYLWKVPLGNYPELAAKGLPEYRYGRTTVDRWSRPVTSYSSGPRTSIKPCARSRVRLQAPVKDIFPYSGNATPATYMIDGKQYVGDRHQQRPEIPRGNKVQPMSRLLCPNRPRDGRSPYKKL